MATWTEAERPDVGVIRQGGAKHRLQVTDYRLQVTG